MSAARIKVGFIGLGNIGKPMAKRLASADEVALKVYDVAPEPVTELVSYGASAAVDLAEIGNWADVICVMVRDDDQVRSVLGEILRALKPRETLVPVSFVIHSTVAPTTPDDLQAEVAKVCGPAIEVIDAPVSGGPVGAAEGTLAIMVGASDGAFRDVEPVLSMMGTKVVHAGEPGAGTMFKLARNLLHFVSFTAVTEAQRLAEAAGLDLVALGDVVRHTDAITGGPGAIMHRATAEKIPDGDFWQGVFGHVRALGEKDLRLAIDLADSLAVEVPLARMSLDRLGPGLGL